MEQSEQEMKPRPEGARRSVIGLYVEVEMDGIGISDSFHRVCDALNLELTYDRQENWQHLLHKGGGWEAHGEIRKVRLITAHEDPKEYIQKVVDAADAYAEGGGSALKLHRTIRDMAEAYGVEYLP